MADTELVIKISDDIYEQAINGTEYDTLSLGIKLRQSVQEGIVIPKGHGDLISRDFMKNIGATCIAKRSETGELVAILSIDNLPSVEKQSGRCRK